MLSPEPWPKEKTQEDASAEKTTQDHEETLLEAIKEYLGRVARGEILNENLARYEDLLERSRAGDIQANRDMINEFAGFGGIAKVGKLAKGAKSVDAVKNAPNGKAFPDRPLPRDKHGNPVPVPETITPHTQLGTKSGRNGNYPQAREFDANGKPVRDIDFTDHGRAHPSPHQHQYELNSTGGTPSRGSAKPLQYPKGH